MPPAQLFCCFGRGRGPFFWGPVCSVTSSEEAPPQGTLLERITQVVYLGLGV